MPFKKGIKKPEGSGRKLGVKNKIRSNVREKLTEMVHGDEFWIRFKAELYGLDGREFVRSCKDIFDIIEPKLTAIAADVTTNSDRSSLVDHLKEMTEEAKN